MGNHQGHRFSASVDARDSRVCPPTVQSDWSLCTSLVASVDKMSRRCGICLGDLLGDARCRGQQCRRGEGCLPRALDARLHLGTDERGEFLDHDVGGRLENNGVRSRIHPSLSARRNLVGIAAHSDVTVRVQTPAGNGRSWRDRVRRRSWGDNGWLIRYMMCLTATVRSRAGCMHQMETFELLRRIRVVAG